MKPAESSHLLRLNSTRARPRERQGEARLEEGSANHYSQAEEDETIPNSRLFQDEETQDEDAHQRNHDVLRRPEIYDPAMCAITYQQLMDLEVKARKKLGRRAYSNATMRDVNHAIIEPSCQETWKPYALQLNPEGLKCDAFITHAWDEPFPAFVESIRQVFHTKMNKPNLWICATALEQGNDQIISSQIGTAEDSLDSSPFMKALSQSSSYVVVRNSTVDVYSRMWCVAELLHAKKLGMIPHRTDVTGPDTFARVKTSCRDAVAYDPIDHDKILQYILREHNCAEIDDFIYQFRAFASYKIAAGKSRSEFLLGVMVFISILAMAIGLGLTLGMSGRVDSTNSLFTPSPSSTLTENTFSTARPDSAPPGPTAVPTKSQVPTSSPSSLLAKSRQPSIILSAPPNSSVATTTSRPTNAYASSPSGVGVLTWSPSPSSGGATASPTSRNSTSNPSTWSPTTETTYECEPPPPTSELDTVVPPYVEILGATYDSKSTSQICYFDRTGTSTFPTELGLFTEMIDIFLSGPFDNQGLTGAIPSELGLLAKLRYLWLFGNQLTGTIPSEFGMLTELAELHLHGHRLNGTIPSEIGMLTELRSLLLCQNQLTGTIPSELGMLTELRSLKLCQNQLTGPIPSELGNVTWYFDSLDVSRNQLTGTIPSMLGQLTALKRLDLSKNKLSGSIPSMLGQLTALETLDLSKNKLSGTIPSELGRLRTLSFLHLFDNQFTGTLPDSICNRYGPTQCLVDEAILQLICTCNTCQPQNPYCS